MIVPTSNPMHFTVEGTQPLCGPIPVGHFYTTSLTGFLGRPRENRCLDCEARLDFLFQQLLSRKA